MIDANENKKPKGKDAHNVKAKEPKSSRAHSPQEASKNPHDQSPKWPGGGKKGEDEKRGA